MRGFGLLLHISSLPSAWGIGDLGPEAHAFARTLGAAGASVWQVLPLNPTSTFIGNSPYSSPSAFAGNPLFISPERLVESGIISCADLECSLNCLPGCSLGHDPSRVHYEAVTAHREFLLCAAFERNRHRLPENKDFQDFCRKHDYWLHDYARFVSLKAEYGGASWVSWPQPLRMRDKSALERWDAHAATAILREKFVQYLFFSQWQALHAVCRKQGVSLLADIPIYVTHDSADVWAAPQFFNLGPDMQPLTVSGVPPDYFSETGQRWGTPVYRWDVLKKDGFAWWKRRLGHVLSMTDMARLDHFRGFCGYWDIPAEEETAINGVWKTAPAAEFLTAMREHLGGLPFVAEDLGVITDDVRETMRAFALPGMHVLQFAFGGFEPARNPDIPHAYDANSVVYTGTHDNAPSRAWFAAAPEQERANVAEYLGACVDTYSIAGQFTRQAFASVADLAMLPVQDALGLDGAARMNTPGIAAGNWGWRTTREQLAPERFAWLTHLARIYGRLPDKTVTADCDKTAAADCKDA